MRECGFSLTRARTESARRNTGENGSAKIRMLAYFMQCMIDNKDTTTI